MTCGGGVNFRIEFEREDDGRWIAEISELPGVMAYGATQAKAEAAVEALALRQKSHAAALRA
jgi:predicted RNase H-like HicB family nuclease